MRLGKHGEDLAAEDYEAKGYLVLERNVVTPFGELDLIVTRGKEVRIVEVKTRSSAAFGAEHSVDRQKFRRMKRAAVWWMRRHQIRAVSFDVVAITAGKLERFEGVDRGAC
nr:YraN family protein [Corynebacterium pseudopelargi]